MLRLVSQIQRCSLRLVRWGLTPWTTETSCAGLPPPTAHGCTTTSSGRCETTHIHLTYTGKKGKRGVTLLESLHWLPVFFSKSTSVFYCLIFKSLAWPGAGLLVWAHAARALRSSNQLLLRTRRRHCVAMAEATQCRPLIDGRVWVAQSIDHFKCRWRPIFFSLTFNPGWARRLGLQEQFMWLCFTWCVYCLF